MSNKKNTWILALLFLLVCYAMASIFMALYGKNVLDADMSSELVLAKQLFDEGSIISKSWYYSSELRVLNTQLVFAPLFALTDNWQSVRSLGTAILLAIMVLCYFFAARGMHLSWTRTLVSAGVLLLPLSSSYIYSVLTGVYYVPHICISFLLFGLICRFVENSKHRKLNFAILFLLAFASGLGGVRQIFVFTMPITIASAVVYGYGFFSSATTSATNKKNIKFFTVSVLSLFSSCMGYIVNKKVLTNIYTFCDYGVDEYAHTVFQGFSADGFEFCINSLIELLGYHQGDVFSSVLIYNLLFSIILAVVYVAFHTVRKLVKHDNNYCVFIASIYFLIAIIMLCLMFCFTNIDRVTRYFVPVFVFLIPIIAYTSFKFGEILGRRVSSVLTTFLLILMMLCCVNTYKNMRKNDVNLELKEIVSVVLNEGYTSRMFKFLERK